ncbi:MAG: hypothetical protein K2X93_29065, partial [Candidatus Obscuribacterales bacterium]|nr:hypothetical protein [Candidatus Obscuribacterales bacterium]
MKFKTKNYLFIGIPLVVQIVITGVLFVNVGTLERKVVEESFAKKIVSLSNEEEQMASECLIAMATLRFNNNDTVIRSMNTVFERHKVNKAKLLKMAAQDPANAKVIEEFVDAVDYLLSQVRDFFDAHLESHKGLNFYRTFPESVANFEVLVTMRKASLAEKALRRRFTERATSDRPDTIREQEQLRFFLVCALVVNVVVAFILATLYGKSTVNRLNQLMNNVHALSEGVVKMSEVKGDDEISDLDEQF